jgi:hypothetical protein
MGSPAYIQQKQRCTSYTTQGASISPPPAPPSGGGGGPPPPAPGGGGPPTGPSCPGGRRPLVIAASTAARCTMARHGGIPLHTAPGNSHPGCTSTCPQAHPVEPSPDERRMSS